MSDINTSSQDNRRISPRKKPRAIIRVECRKGALGLGANICVQMLDISETGIRLVVKAELRPKDEVEILITGTGLSGPVKRLADVCWIVPMENKNWCIGVRMQKLLPYRDLQIIALNS